MELQLSALYFVFVPLRFSGPVLLPPACLLVPFINTPLLVPPWIGTPVTVPLVGIPALAFPPFISASTSPLSGNVLSVAGADVNQRNKFNGATVLHFAYQYEHDSLGLVTYALGSLSKTA